MSEELYALPSRNNNPEKKFIRSFGRIKSRKLSDHKKSLLQDLLPKYKIDDSLNISWIPAFTGITLEIGFGFGDFLFENAKNNPDILFIGCEPHLNGVVNLLAKLETYPLTNIKLFVGDSRLLLEQIPNQTFSTIYILNPDPWPKAKHYKRRLINVDFLEFIKSKTKYNAELIITTDDDGYKKWIMAEIFKNGLWDWQASSKADWKTFPANWTQTKYQKKAEIAGRENVFLQFK